MFLALLASATGAAATSLPPATVRTMIRDVRRWTATDGEKLWPGFARAPVQIDVIDDRHETLFCRRQAKGFVFRGRDDITGCTMLSRPRVLDRDLTASLGIDENVQVVAIGLPTTLNMPPSTWQATLLHEAFHQYQSALLGYRAAVQQVRATLHPDKVDWPLTYAFPYGDAAVGKAFAAMTTAARQFLTAASAPSKWQAIIDYVHARRVARTTVTPTDWCYYEFQIGQEGVARWTEIKLTESAGRRNPDMAKEAHERRAGLASSLDAIDRQGLRIWRRGALYVYGAIEAEMLDGADPGWRAAYRQDPFGLGDRLDRLAVGASPVR